MANQPVKKKFDYEKYFSNELRELISYTVSEVANSIPFTSLTFDIFFISALEQHDCLLYKAVNGFLTSSNIEEIHDNVLELVSDRSLTPLRPGRTIDYSNEIRNLFVISNGIREEMSAKTITSDMVLLSFMRVSPKNNPIRKLLANAGITENTTFELVKKMRDTVDAISSMSEEQFDDFADRYVASIDPAEPGGDRTVITIGSEADLKKLDRFFDTIANGSASSKKVSKKKNVEACDSLNAMAEKGELEPLIGREKEIFEIAKVLVRKNCNNVVLVGEPGVGKTAIVYGLAEKIVEGTAPLLLKDCEVLRLDVSEMVSGSQFRGQFEERVSSLIKNLKSVKSPILFIDNIHNFTSERSKNEFDLFGTLEPLFNDRGVKVIVATTPKGYHNSFETSPDAMRRFQKIMIESPDKQQCFEIISGLTESFENYHNVRYSEEVIRTAINLAERYITERKTPSSAIDLMDEAGALKKMEYSEPPKIYNKRNKIALLKKRKEEAIKKDDVAAAKDAEYEINGLTIDIADTLDRLRMSIETNGKPEVTLDDLYRAVSEHTGIPVSKVSVSEKQQLAKINDILRANIIGQDEAIDVISRGIKRNKVGLVRAEKPILSCMCIGNTGCGKTLLAKMLAREIFGDEKYLVRFDMSEYSDKTAVNKLIGASAGYVGYNEGGLLTEAIKNKKHAVLLIDEIEKATDEIFNIFLQILDEGFLTDNTGYKVDFKSTILILTSNVGAKKAANEKTLGFNVDDNAEKKDVIEKELKNRFPPEFLNRLDEIVYFNALSDENLKDIIRLEMGRLSERLGEISCSLTYTPEVIDYIFKIIEPEKEYGARPIGRAIRKEIENRITDIILAGDEDAREFSATVENDMLKVE